VIDNWALAFAILYLVGYAGHCSAILRDPDEGPRIGGWIYLVGLFWPLAALGELMTPEE